MTNTSTDNKSPKNSTRLAPRVTTFAAQLAHRYNLFEFTSKLTNWFNKHPLYGTTAIIVFSNYFITNSTAQQRANILEERNFNLLTDQQKIKDDFSEKLAKQEDTASAIISDLKNKLDDERKKSASMTDSTIIAPKPDIDPKIREQCSLWATICSNYSQKNSIEPRRTKPATGHKPNDL